MKRRWKILLALALVAVALVAGALFLGNEPRPPAPGAILLPDGTMARLEAVTYGTNHLVGPRLALWSQRLPMSAQIWLRRIFGRRASIRFSSTSDSPKLALWLNRDIMARPLQNGHCECVLADTNGFLAGPHVFYGPTYPLEVREFAAFPRRDPYFILNIYHHDATGAVLQCGSMNIPNPEYRRYPQWKPETLPATKRVDDIEVTLEDFRTGLNPVSRPERSADGARWLVFATNRWGGTNASGFLFSVRALAETNQPWHVADVELSDATGNIVTASKLNSGGIGEASYRVFTPALWPGEGAWKVRLVLFPYAAAATNDQFTFEAVPLGAPGSQNRVGWTTNFNGVTVTLDQIHRNPPFAPGSIMPRESSSQFIFKTSGLTNPVRLDCMTAVANTGMSLDGIWNIGRDARTNVCWITGDAQTADFTFAVRRGRSVEFLVKPLIGPLKVPLVRAPTAGQ